VVSWHINKCPGTIITPSWSSRPWASFSTATGPPFGEGNGTGPGQVASELVVVLLEESGGQGGVFADNELIAEGKADREARKLVARELGHQRISVTYSYIPKG
jgi:hypothetical protein